jgi:hypothetical protein
MTEPEAYMTEHDLKKQSQFPGADIDAISTIPMVYGELGR